MKECDFCDRKMEDQTRFDLSRGLCWFMPDEKWICPTCLKHKIRIVIKSE